MCRPPRWFGLIIAAVAVVLAAVDAGARQNRGATAQAQGLITGQVVDAVTRQPIAGAVVILSAPGGSTVASGGGAIVDSAFSNALVGRRLTADPPQQVLTDDSGRFVFQALGAGAYLLIAKKPMHAGGANGQTRPYGPGVVLEITAGQRISGVTLQLWPPASVTGRVVDETGDPVSGVPVRALVCNIANGRPLLTLGSNARTDDRGEYRISGLGAGDYVIAIPATRHAMPTTIADAYRDAIVRDDGSAAAMSRTFARSRAPVPTTAAIDIAGITLDQTVPPARPDAAAVYETVFHPGVRRVTDAIVVSLRAGDERAAVNFTLTPSPAVRISGRLVDANGPAARIGLHLLPLDYAAFSSEMTIEAATTVSDATGAFVFAGVPAGEYLIKVWQTAADGEPARYAEMPVSVAASDLTGLSLTLREGLRLGGRVVFRDMSAADRTAVTGVDVTLSPADGRSVGPTGVPSINADNRFVSPGYPPGQYFVLGSVRGPTGWTLESALVAGRDGADMPVTLTDRDVEDVVVTFTNVRSEIRGSVRTASGVVDPGALVIAFPRDFARWLADGASRRRVRQVRPGANGAFTLSGLPAGEYSIVALSEDSNANPLQPLTYYAALSAGSMHVTVTAASREVVALTSRVIK